ncbi:MAG: flagellar export chaperone FlgN [Candidatus Scalindua sp.]
MTKDKIQMPNQNEEAISYLKRKLEHYEEILKLAKKQEEAIKSENIKDLNSLITEKENHIKSIKRFEKLNPTLLNSVGSNPKNLISDKRFDSLMKQLRSIITKLVTHDQDSIKLLSSTIDSIKTKASNLNKKIRRLKSSRIQQIRTPRFIDVVQ